MPATPSDISAAIPAGTFAQGDRQKFTTDLQTALGGEQGGAALAGGQPQPGALPSPPAAGQDPMAALLSGDLDPGGPALSLTDGLSVGAGAGTEGFEPAPDPRQVRLMEIATQADSPVLRASARVQLRLMNDEPL